MLVSEDPQGLGLVLLGKNQFLDPGSLLFAKEVRIILMMTKHLTYIISFEPCNNANNCAELMGLLSLRKLKHREVTQLAQGHTVIGRAGI